MSINRPVTRSILQPLIEVVAAKESQSITLTMSVSSQITITDPAEYAGSYIVSDADVAAGPAVLVDPRIIGTPVAGATITLQPGLYAHRAEGGLPTTSVQWLRGGVPVSGATKTTYRVDAKDVDQGLEVRETVANADGSTSRIVSVLAPADAAPRVIAVLPDVSFDQGSGAHSIDTSSAFEGANLVFSVTGAGASIDPATGVVSHDTSVAMAATQVTVTATNGTGSASVSYDVTVQAVISILAPSIAVPDVTRPFGGDMTLDLADYVTDDGGDAQIAFGATGSGVSIAGSVITVAGDVGTVAVAVTATNGGGTTTDSFDFTVKALAPSLSVPDVTRSFGGDMTLDLADYVTDDGGDAQIAFGLNPTTGVSLNGSVLTFADAIGNYGVLVHATNSGGSSLDMFNFTIVASDSGYSVTDNIAGNDVSLTDNGDGTHTATVTGSDIDYNGSYLVQGSDLATGGPVNIVPAIVGEGPANSFTAKPGLWISPDSDPAAVTQEWYLNGEATGTTGLGYSDAANALIEYVETASNLAVSGVEERVTAREVAAAMSADTNAVAWWRAEDATYDGSNLITAVPDNTGNGHGLTVPAGFQSPTFDAAETAIHFPLQAAPTPILWHPMGANSGAAPAPMASAIDGGGSFAIFLVTKQTGDDLLGIVPSYKPSYLYNENKIISTGSQGFVVGAGMAHDSNSVRGSLEMTIAGSQSVKGGLWEGKWVDQIVIQEIWIDNWTGGALLSGEAAADFATTAVTNQSLVDYTNADMILGGYPSNNSGGTYSKEIFHGRVYEVFMTTDASAGNRQAIREELVAKYGIAK